MEELVKVIVENLVKNKEAVTVSSSDVDGVCTIKVIVHDEDMGRVIGKGGKIAQSIRAIVRTASAGSGVKYNVQIGEKAE